MRLTVTDADLDRMAAALTHYADMLAEMGDDKSLDANEDDRVAKKWAQEEGHNVERLSHKMAALAFAVQAHRALLDGDKEKAMHLTQLSDGALAEFENMSV